MKRPNLSPSHACKQCSIDPSNVLLRHKRLISCHSAPERLIQATAKQGFEIGRERSIPCGPEKASLSDKNNIPNSAMQGKLAKVEAFEIQIEQTLGRKRRNKRASPHYGNHSHFDKYDALSHEGARTWISPCSSPVTLSPFQLHGSTPGRDFLSGLLPTRSHPSRSPSIRPPPHDGPDANGRRLTSP